MSGTDWNELESLWSDLPEKAAPVVAELKRMRRWRWVSRAFVVGDVAMTLFGIGIGIWLIVRGDAFSLMFGSATIAFTGAAAGLSLWARWGGIQPAGAPVQDALNLAVSNARVGVRLAVATMWTVCLGLVFLAVLAAGRAWSRPADVWDSQGLLIAVGASLVWLAGVLAGAIIYYGQRRDTLAKLERLREGFLQEV